MFIEIAILWLTRYKAEPRYVQKAGGLAIFACFIYCETLLKIIDETTLQFGSPFKLCSRGRGSGSFLWKNIGPGYVDFANVLVQMPRGSPGSTPRMAADKCITGPKSV